MSEFKLRKLQRQRRSRRAAVSVLNREELAARFQVPELEVKAALQRAGWQFHEDATGGIWASNQDPSADEVSSNRPADAEHSEQREK